MEDRFRQTEDYKPNYRIVRMPITVRSLKIMKGEKNGKWHKTASQSPPSPRTQDDNDRAFSGEIGSFEIIGLGLRCR